MKGRKSAVLAAAATVGLGSGFHSTTSAVSHHIPQERYRRGTTSRAYKRWKSYTGEQALFRLSRFPLGWRSSTPFSAEPGDGQPVRARLGLRDSARCPHGQRWGSDKNGVIRPGLQDSDGSELDVTVLDGGGGR